MPALTLDQRLLDGEEPHRIPIPSDQKVPLKAVKGCCDRIRFETGGCYQVFGRNAAAFRNTVVYDPIQFFLTHTYSFFRGERYSYSCAIRTIRALWLIVLRSRPGDGCGAARWDVG